MQIQAVAGKERFSPHLGGRGTRFIGVAYVAPSRWLLYSRDEGVGAGSVAGKQEVRLRSTYRSRTGIGTFRGSLELIASTKTIAASRVANAVRVKDPEAERAARADLAFLNIQEVIEKFGADLTPDYRDRLVDLVRPQVAA